MKKDRANKRIADSLIKFCEKVIAEGDKEIEEMAQKMCGGYSKCEDCFKLSEELFGSTRPKKERCIAYNYANVLYNAGYRKIPEDAVVLTREEQEEHVIMTKVNYRSIMQQLKQLRVELKKQATRFENTLNKNFISVKALKACPDMECIKALIKYVEEEED